MKLYNYLYFFNHIISEGTKEEGVYTFSELTAWYEFDGYTCYIGYKDLVISLYFHSQYSCDYTNRQTLKEFENIVGNIIKK